MNIHVSGIPQRKKKDDRVVLEEKMNGNFPNLVKDIILQIQKAE